MCDLYILHIQITVLKKKKIREKEMRIKGVTMKRMVFS